MEPRLREILASYEGRKDELIPILQQTQAALGYLPAEAMLQIAKFTGVPESRVYAVATFYAQFRFTPIGRQHVMVCRGTSCHVRGAPRILQEIEKQLGIKEGETTPDREYSLETIACLGACDVSPCMMVNKRVEPQLTPARVAGLLRKAGDRDAPLPRDALGTAGERLLDGIPQAFETPVLKGQVRRVLRNCGLMDPTQIGQYMARGGYSGLGKAIALAPEQILEEVKEAGLRGRGGAAFPTWRKWQFAREAKGAKKYVVCNGSEGDPGTFSNKLLLESDPHSVLEGMLIAARAVGAQHGYVYCPAEYPLALERLRIAVGQMEERGLLGDGILGSAFNFHLKIKEGAGAYICGEETALLECIEGRRGVPRLRPPFPPTSGLWSQPTVINNVETLACVTLILERGAGWFAELGTEKSKGTKLFCLSGNVQRSGVVEVPFGTTLREIVCAIGGGAADGQGIKAVHAGGPGGGCLPASLLDTPADQDSLAKLGSSVGSGGIVVIDDRACMVDLARNSLEFALRECCGQCVPCRLGTKQMLDILTDICEGRGRPEDVALLAELAEGIKLGSLCGLGQAAPNPLLSTIRYFRDEYESHIVRGQCPTGVCSEMANVG
jgi:NADH:ubiquinone oxidoreductase subunit F (NADH-binding)/NADH:ubiquinone oxidoreductase subunit E